MENPFNPLWFRGCISIGPTNWNRRNRIPFINTLPCRALIFKSHYVEHKTSLYYQVVGHSYDDAYVLSVSAGLDG